MTTAPVIGELLAAVENTPLTSEAASDAAVNISEIRRAYDRAVKLPQAWWRSSWRGQAAPTGSPGACKADDFAVFRPSLEMIVALKREEAQAVGYKGVPYDALLDEYEPGADTAEISESSRLFAKTSAVGASNRVVGADGRRARFWPASILWSVNKRSAAPRRPRLVSISRRAGWM